MAIALNKPNFQQVKHKRERTEKEGLFVCGFVRTWVLLENTAGAKLSAALMYINWFYRLYMALISEQNKKQRLQKNTETDCWYDWNENNYPYMDYIMKQV